jgi:hypothetical protein
MQLQYNNTKHLVVQTYKKVTQEDGMVIHWASQISHHIVLCLTRSQKITWNQLCSLVNELIKGMLSIRSRLAPVESNRTNVRQSGIDVAMQSF